jgi:hypothetical protein
MRKLKNMTNKRFYSTPKRRTIADHYPAGGGCDPEPTAEELAEPEPEPEPQETSMHPTTLDDYMTAYGPALARQAADACEPLHVPGRDPILEPALLRPPFEAQAHVITGGIKALERQNAIQIAAEMGTGKTLISQAIIQGHAQHFSPGGYRALVFCPPHLTHKWEREINETVQNAHVHHIESYRDLTSVCRSAPPFGRGWWIVSNTRAKMGPKWWPAYKMGRYPSNLVSGIKGPDEPPMKGFIYCPRCVEKIQRLDKASGEWIDLTPDDLFKKKLSCEKCGEPLWQWNHEIDRWPVATYIHKKLKGWFQYLVIDESHQTKSAESAVGQAMGSLVAAVDRTICLTGTLLGGYAWHVRPLLFRIAPRSLIEEGLGWNNPGAFDERYGRIERKVRDVEKHGGSDNRQSRGKTQKTTKYVRPGVMPTLFGRHLIQNTIFLSLDEVADNLPRLDEEVIGVAMDPELADAYREVEEEITKAVKRMLQKKDKRLLSRMLITLLGYPDMPWGWGEIGYYDYDEETHSREWVHVVTPKNLDPRVVRPKEKAIQELVKGHWQAGRQTWVYCTMTDARDVNERLRSLLANSGLRTEILRSSVETGDREQWIADKAPSLDCIVSHPQLVETGLDLFSKSGSYNFSDLVFYSTGFNLFTLRQAARRSWRIGQKRDCTVKYLHYAGTMQARAMTLMGKKLAASASIEGKFSSEGLAAMAGDEGSLEMALAKSLVQKLDDLDVGRAWTKVGQKPRPQPELTTSPKPSVVNPGPDSWLVPPKPKKADRHVSFKQMSMF